MVPGGTRRSLLRMKPGANHRPDAIRADHDVPVNGAAVRQDHRRAGGCERESARLAAEDQRLRAHGVEQRAVKRGPQRHHRSQRPRAERDPLQRRAIGAPDVEQANLGAGAGDRVEDAELAQRHERIGRERQRETELARTAGALDDPDVPAAAPQRERGGQPADPRPNDHCRRHARIQDSG